MSEPKKRCALSELDDDVRELVDAAGRARRHAHAPARTRRFEDARTVTVTVR